MREQLTIEVLEALVGFDTTSRNSNLALVEWVEVYLDRFGVAHERVPDKTGGKANVWATIGPSGVPGTILSGHTDVVPVEGQSWSNDPFRLTERNGRLYGRGATDMKGFDACCLAAVPDMVAAPLTRPIHLALSYDEEVGCIGVRGMIARLERAKVKPAASCAPVLIEHSAFAAPPFLTRVSARSASPCMARPVIRRSRRTG